MAVFVFPEQEQITVKERESSTESKSCAAQVWKTCKRLEGQHWEI